MEKYICTVCNYVYDEVAEGVLFDDLPDGWVCPVCGAPKDVFEGQGAAGETESPVLTVVDQEMGDVRGLSPAELGALFSNLSKGSEKQFREEESALFGRLMAYFDAKSEAVGGVLFSDLEGMLQRDLSTAFPAANHAAAADEDRGALRALVWSEKVSRMQASILRRYEKEGDALLENTNVYVCEVCGFIHIGDAPPAICPVCKVPDLKITKVQRG
jgi:rubrerythrin